VFNGARLGAADEEFLIDSLEHEVYFNSLIEMLHSFRRFGLFSIAESSFSDFSRIASIYMTRCMNCFNVGVALNIFNLANTFYYEKEGERFYLLDSIEDHAIFSSLDFWEGCILFSSINANKLMTLSSLQMLKQQKSPLYEAKVSNFEENIENSLLSVAFMAKQVKTPGIQVFEKIQEFFEVFGLGERGRTKLMILMGS